MQRLRQALSNIPLTIETKHLEVPPAKNEPKSELSTPAQVSRRSSAPQTPNTPNSHRNKRTLFNAKLDNVKRILHKENITNEEALMIYEAFQDDKIINSIRVNNSNFFKDLVYVDMFRKAKMKSFDSGTVIFRDGEKNNGKLYYILSGTVSLVKKEGNNNNNSNNNNTNQLKSALTAISKMSTLYRGTQDLQKSPKVVNLSAFAEAVHQSKNSDDSKRLFVRQVAIPSREESANVSIMESHSNRKSPNSRDRNSTSPILHSRSSINKNNEDSTRVKTPNKRQTIAGLQGRTSKNIKILRSSKTIDVEEVFASRKGSMVIQAQAVEKVEIQSIKEFIAQHGKLIKKIGLRGCFGESAVEDARRRPMTAIAKTPIEVMELDVQDFKNVIDDFSVKKKQKMTFLSSTVPGLDSAYTLQILEDLLISLEEKVITFNECFIKEGDVGQSFYVLWEGSCQISKTVVHDNTEKMKNSLEMCNELYGLKKSETEFINICHVEKGSLIGEEFLFNNSKNYEYNVRVTSGRALLITLNKQKLSKCPSNIAAGIKEVFIRKRAKNLEMFHSILKMKNLKFDATRLPDAFPLVVSSHEKLGYNPNIHPKNPAGMSQILNRSNSLINSKPEIESMLNSTLTHNDQTNNKVWSPSYVSSPTQKVDSTNTDYTIEGLIFQLHKYSDPNKFINIVEERATDTNANTNTNTHTHTNTLNEVDSIEVEVDQKVKHLQTKSMQRIKSAKINKPRPQSSSVMMQNKKSESNSPSRNKQTKSRILQRKRGADEFTLAVQNMVDLGSRKASNQTDISLRIGSTPSILKVEHCYSLMQSRFKTNENTQPDESTPKEINILQFVASDLEGDLHRRIAFQQRRAKMLQKARTLDVTTFNLNSTYQSSDLPSPFINKTYQKIHKRKRKDIRSVGNILQLSTTPASPATTSPNTTMTNLNASAKYKTLSVVPPKSALGVVSETRRNESTRPLSSILVSPTRPASASAMSFLYSGRETMSPNKSSLYFASPQEWGSRPISASTATPAGSKELKHSVRGMISPERELNEKEGRRDPIGEVSSGRVSSAARGGGIKKLGAIPKRVGGFMSKNYHKIKRNEQPRGINVIMSNFAM